MSFYQVNITSNKSDHPRGEVIVTGYFKHDGSIKERKIMALKLLQTELDPENCMFYKSPRIQAISESEYTLAMQIELPEHSEVDELCALFVLFGDYEGEEYEADELADAREFLSNPDTYPECVDAYQQLRGAVESQLNDDEPVIDTVRGVYLDKAEAIDDVLASMLEQIKCAIRNHPDFVKHSYDVKEFEAYVRQIVQNFKASLHSDCNIDSLLTIIANKKPVERYLSHDVVKIAINEASSLKMDSTDADGVAEPLPEKIVAPPLAPDEECEQSNASTTELSTETGDIDGISGVETLSEVDRDWPKIEYPSIFDAIGKRLSYPDYAHHADRLDDYYDNVAAQIDEQGKTKEIDINSLADELRNIKNPSNLNSVNVINVVSRHAIEETEQEVGLVTPVDVADINADVGIDEFLTNDSCFEAHHEDDYPQPDTDYEEFSSLKNLTSQLYRLTPDKASYLNARVNYLLSTLSAMGVCHG